MVYCSEESNLLLRTSVESKRRPWLAVALTPVESRMAEGEKMLHQSFLTHHRHSIRKENIRCERNNEVVYKDER